VKDRDRAGASRASYSWTFQDDGQPPSAEKVPPKTENEKIGGKTSLVRLLLTAAVFFCGSYLRTTLPNIG